MYQADNTRYERMKYRRCGRSGLLFPVISLGFWQNFGGINEFETCRETVTKAFDNGITHFDLANNCGLVLTVTGAPRNILRQVWIRV